MSKGVNIIICVARFIVAAWGSLLEGSQQNRQMMQLKLTNGAAKDAMCISGLTPMITNMSVVNNMVKLGVISQSVAEGNRCAAGLWPQCKRVRVSPVTPSQAAGSLGCQLCRPPTCIALTTLSGPRTTELGESVEWE